MGDVFGTSEKQVDATGYSADNAPLTTHQTHGLWWKRPKLQLRLIQFMRTVLTTLSSLGTCVFPTTSAAMEQSSLMAQVLLTLEMDLQLSSQRIASVQVFWRSVARIQTLFHPHHLQLSSTSQSVAEETLMVLVPESRDSRSQSLSLESGLTCVLCCMRSQWSKRLDMLENQRLSICTSVEDL